MTDRERGAGTQFSRYVVTKRLERSWPHFSFFEAMQEGLDRKVELRVFTLPPKGAEASMARFQREYKTLCKLDHPNIIKILDLGVANGSPYYVTDLRSAKSVGELLAKAEAPLNCTLVLTLACQICSALAYLHDRSILHRNLSTDSIFWDEENSFFYIGEFSMGKDQSLDDITDLGVPELYPLIETPESLSGRSHDERSDLFLFGRVLYQALTLKVPEVHRGGGSLLMSSWADARKLGIRQYNPEVPLGLEAIVLKLLDEDASLRYRSAEDLLSRLERERLCHQGRLALAEQREQAVERNQCKRSTETNHKVLKKMAEDEETQRPSILELVADLPPLLRYCLFFSLLPLLLFALSWWYPEETIIAKAVQQIRPKSKLKKVKRLTTKQRRKVDDYVLKLEGSTSEQEFHMRWALLAQWRRTFPVHQRDDKLSFSRLKGARITFQKNVIDGCVELDRLIKLSKRTIARKD